MAERFDGVACGKFHSPTASCRLHCLRQVTSYFSCDRDCNSTLPLCIEGNWRVSEGSGKLASLLPSESQFETGFRAQYGEAGREFFDFVIVDSMIYEVLLV